MNQRCRSEKTITMTVERFVLGQGYVVEPRQVKVTQDMNYATLLDQELKTNHLTYTHTGPPASFFIYQESIRQILGHLKFLVQSRN